MYVIGLFILTSALAPRTGTVTATQRRMIEALKTAHLTITPNKEEWERLCRVLQKIRTKIKITKGGGVRVGAALPCVIK